MRADLTARAEALLRQWRTILPPALSLLLFAVVVVGKAWVCDDAYITFRTVERE